MGHLHRNALLAGANRVAELVAAGVAVADAKRVARECPKGVDVVEFHRRVVGVTMAADTSGVLRPKRQVKRKVRRKKKAARKAA